MQVWERLIRVCRVRHARITVQYVPGHVELERQEEADEAAKQAARTCEQGAARIPLGLVKCALRAQQRGELRGQIPEGHLWLRATDGKLPDHEGLSREHQRRMACLRAGRCRVTQDIAHRFSTRTIDLEVPANGRHGLTLEKGLVAGVGDGTPAQKAKIRPGTSIEKVGKRHVATDAEARAALSASRGKLVRLKLRTEPSKLCPAGCEDEDGTEHIMCRCPVYSAARLSVFGDRHPPLTVLRTAPWKVLRYLRSIGRVVSEDGKPQAATQTRASEGPAAQAPASTGDVGTAGTDGGRAG
eukprot:gene11061-biopygen7192